MPQSQRSNWFVELIRRIICSLAARLCPPEPPPPPPPPPRDERRLDYFVPGQINVLTFHDRGLSSQEIVNRIREHPFVRANQLPEPVVISPARVITFTIRDRPEAFSLGFIDLPALRDDPARLIKLIHTFNADLNERNQGEPEKPSPDQYGAAQSRPAGEAPRPELVEGGTSGQPGGEQRRISPLDALMRHAPGAFTIYRAAPNWLSGGAPYVGGGGPGSRPVGPAGPLVANAATGKQPWEFTLPSSLPPGTGGGGVEIAILDTAPSLADRNRAHTDWAGTNPLIDDLLGPAGTLDITYNSANIMQLADGTLAEHPYLMPDHGVFVASIIRSLAPSASLKLIEVLNPYGLGTTESIAQGLQQLTNRPIGSPPLLVNLSLVLNIPPADLLDALKAEDPSWEPFTQQTLQESSETLEIACQVLRTEDVFLIAASGNDGDPAAETDNDPNTVAHPLPRYPAAYNAVRGVAALNADGTPAPYTDKCDDLLTDGLAVFGGNIDPNAQDVPDPQHGMLGVFTSITYPNPNGLLNDGGWARWSGTSFAVPVLAGAIATLIGATGISTPQQAFAALQASGASPTVVGQGVQITQG